MNTAVIVAAVRTAVGKRGGKLAGIRPDDLLADILTALVERAGIDPREVEDVVVGCVDQVGEQGLNIARNAALIAGFPRADHQASTQAFPGRTRVVCAHHVPIGIKQPGFRRFEDP